VGEIRSSTISERGARIDDKRSEAAMEKKTTRILLTN
jgi:sulfate adenylyltransferase subunit 2